MYESCTGKVNQTRVECLAQMAHTESQVVSGWVTNCSVSTVMRTKGDIIIFTSLWTHNCANGVKGQSQRTLSFSSVSQSDFRITGKYHLLGHEIESETRVCQNGESVKRFYFSLHQSLHS